VVSEQVIETPTEEIVATETPVEPPAQSDAVKEDTTTPTPATETTQPTQNDIERRRQEELNQQTDAGYSIIALDYLFTGGRDVILSTDYLLQALVGGFNHAAKEIDAIRNKYADKLGNLKDDINSDIYNKMMSEIRDVINKNYNNTKATEIFDKILKNATGFTSREGNQTSIELDKLNEQNESKINTKYNTELEVDEDFFGEQFSFVAGSSETSEEKPSEVKDVIGEILVDEKDSDQIDSPFTFKNTKGEEVVIKEGFAFSADKPIATARKFKSQKGTFIATFEKPTDDEDYSDLEQQEDGSVKSAPHKKGRGYIIRLDEKGNYRDHKEFTANQEEGTLSYGSAAAALRQVGARLKSDLPAEKKLEEAKKRQAANEVSLRAQSREKVRKLFQNIKGSLYEQDYKPLSTLQDLCKRHPHLTILGIHHVNKSDNEDVFKKISGTTGITAACDTILVAERDNDSIEGTLHIIGRKVRYTKLSITYNESRLYWELVGGSTDPNAAIRQSILAILAEGGSQRLTTVGVVKQLKQIGASIGVTRAQRILADMVVAGQLASGKGENPRFWLATAPAPEVQEEIPLSPPVNQVSPPGWISRQDIEIQEEHLVVVDQDFNYPAIVEDAPERFFRAIDDERRGVVYENLVAIWYYRQAGDWEQALELASTFANDLEAAEWFTKEEAIISISKALQAMDRRAKTIHK
jgi:hypothetical protein